MLFYVTSCRSSLLTETVRPFRMAFHFLDATNTLTVKTQVRPPQRRQRLLLRVLGLLCTLNDDFRFLQDGFLDPRKRAFEKI